VTQMRNGATGKPLDCCAKSGGTTMRKFAALQHK